jgi:phytoene desaturase
MIRPNQANPTADNNRHNRHRVAVVGSGLAGLATAATLAARGYSVTVYERNDDLGGKAAVRHAHTKAGDFRFDMGPTILTIPRILRRLFEEAGRSLDDYCDLVRLNPQWRCFFDDGAQLDLDEHVPAMQQTLRDFCANAEDAEGYRDFIDYAARLHDISNRFFFDKPIGGIGDMFDAANTLNKETLKDVLAMRMGRSVAGTIRKYVDDPRLAQMLDHFTQYVGSSPYGSPAILCGIAHMQTSEGVWYPRGGTRAVPDALIQLGSELGVTYRTGCPVKAIDVENKRVVGLRLADGSHEPAAAVVSNMDAVRTHRELIGGEIAHRFESRRNYEPACSGVVLYLGLDKAYEHLAHHSFVFSRDPEEEFDAIYKHGEPAPDPTCYLAATTRSEPATAPPGGEALYVLVHTPYIRPHHDWRRDGKLYQNYRQNILDKLKTTGQMPDLEQRIVHESALTPRDIHDRYAVLRGAIYGLASHGKWTGAFKPSNRTAVQGLYLAGGAAHPGPGMPMVLMSGWIAADTLDRDQVVEPRRKPQSDHAAPAKPPQAADTQPQTSGLG